MELSRTDRSFSLQNPHHKWENKKDDDDQKTERWELHKEIGKLNVNASSGSIGMP